MKPMTTISQKPSPRCPLPVADSTTPELKAKDGPGLYAIYGPPEVWQLLGLGVSAGRPSALRG
ncbi:MAG: hypothetical protein KIS61_33660 [Candidatus Eremiobacteraeota bacterium]|nr:hypothetical protein [Candidatus Eremiobacteraeota bacterium]